MLQHGAPLFYLRSFKMLDEKHVLQNAFYLLETAIGRAFDTGARH